jgi:uncharacterized protein (DUF58 family)
MHSEILDPEVIARIAQLQLVAKEASLAAIAGIHPARRRGSSVEFAEHKEYTPGDDVRRIDWRAYARLDRYYLKQYQEEANVRLMLVVDHSGSMGYGDGKRGANKLELARTLAGSLAHLALTQRDGVGLLTAGDGGFSLLPARTRSTHFEEVLSRLVACRAGGKAELGRALEHLAEASRGPGLCVIITDLFDRPDPTPAMQLLMARGTEVAVLHVQHPDERDFPFETPAFFASMEVNDRVFVQPRVLRQRFVAEMAAFRERSAAQLASLRIDHHLVWSDAQPADVLSRFLAQRMRAVRVRA